MAEYSAEICLLLSSRPLMHLDVLCRQISEGSLVLHGSLCSLPLCLSSGQKLLELSSESERRFSGRHSPPPPHPYTTSAMHLITAKRKIINTVSYLSSMYRYLSGSNQITLWEYSGPLNDTERAAFVQPTYWEAVWSGAPQQTCRSMGLERSGNRFKQLHLGGRFY